jgi:hypothetical protein
MITEYPATALALDAYIGEIAPGHKADITIIGKHDDNPSQNILESHLQDVQLVMVGGEALYGNEAGMNKLHDTPCEALRIYGSRKRICVQDTKDPVPGSNETLTEIRSSLLTRYPQLAPLAP